MEQGPVSVRIAALTKRRGVRQAMIAAGAAGVATPLLVPLARVPGYESALAANLAVAILGGAFGVAAVRQERDPAGAFDPGPSGTTAALRSTAAASALAALAIAPFLLASLAVGLAGTACSVTAGLAWYAVLPLPSAILAASLGVLCGAASARPCVPGLLYAAVAAGSLLLSLWPVAFGPQSFVYDHLAGFLPGPLYDEVVRIRPPLLVFRSITLAWSGAVVGAAALCWRGGRLGLPRARPGAIALLAASVALAIVGGVRRSEDGWQQSAASLERILGARTEGRRCSVVHPREKNRRALALFVDECDARVEELERFFGVEAPRIEVFLYRSKREKGRLVGASGTQFAKPWLGQIHVDARGFPHPILKHELAHVVTAPLGRLPFRVPAALLGLLPIQGLVEGAAVAADWPAGELSVHEEAKALRAMGLAPRLDRILSATGFWSEAARRAYTYAGSFVRWLVDTRGPRAFASVYRDGDFEAAYGAPLHRLVEEWETFLDGLPLPERARVLAERRFRRPAIFRRPCAREVADLSAEAAAALSAGDHERAAEIYSKCYTLVPGDPAYLRAQASAWARAGEPARIEALLGALDGHRARSDALAASMHALLGDALAAQGRLEDARAAYDLARSLEADEGALRSLAVKLEAIGDADRARAVLPFLETGSDARLFAVREWLAAHPDYATGWYLVGRRLQQRGEPEAAVSALDRALAGSLPEALVFEAERLRAVALMEAGRPREACRALEPLAAAADPHRRAIALDLLILCRHAR
ncbi:MAG TPA: hypothetical protein VN033_10940 [Vulgatibacter sp.]|nr:hypothetical protein [Vulgatibacter sp.]